MKYEYYVFSMFYRDSSSVSSYDKMIKELLNEYAEDGWELFSVAPFSADGGMTYSYNTFYLRRPKDEQKNK